MEKIKQIQKKLSELNNDNIRHIKFYGLDDFNRPVYKVQEGNYYIGDVDKLFTNETKEEIDNYFRNNIDKLVYFGSSFNEEPDGRPLNKNLQLIID